MDEKYGSGVKTCRSREEVSQFFGYAEFKFVYIDSYFDPFEFKENPIKQKETHKYYFLSVDSKQAYMYGIEDNVAVINDSWLGNSI